MVLCLFGTGHLRAGKEAEAQQEHNLSVVHNLYVDKILFLNTKKNLDGDG